jgi:hypothetical protein
MVKIRCVCWGFVEISQNLEGCSEILNFWSRNGDSHLELRHSEFLITLNKQLQKLSLGGQIHEILAKWQTIVKNRPSRSLRRSNILRGKKIFWNWESTKPSSKHSLYCRPYFISLNFKMPLKSSVKIIYNMRNLWNLMMALAFRVAAVCSNFEGIEEHIHISILAIFSRISE